MSTQNLPYKGYSWPFTQHAPALEPLALYELLYCASEFEGQENPGRSISNLMVERDLLTANVRDGRPDPWRDYQQVLAELGLIYSTKIERRLRLTAAGNMYLAGEIGFSELITSQALRYQYPNGQKYDLQARLRHEVGGEFQNLIDLQLANGVLIKPATLIGRVLIDLFERGENVYLSIDECLKHLLPIKVNTDWRLAVENLLNERKGIPLPPVNKHARRNMQDWFKFLSFSDYFSLQSSKIVLSEYAKQAIEQFKEFCEAQCDPATYWRPVDSDRESRLAWFHYFGEIPYELEVSRRLEEIDQEYKDQNYVAGIDEDIEDESLLVGKLDLSLVELSRESSRINVKTTGTRLDPKTALQNLDRGIIRRQIKTQAHDDIVLSLGQYLKEQGALIYEDSDSVDLLAIWPDKKETLFEVKTITKRSTHQRIRMAVGQLEEYTYRRITTSKIYPDKVLVINAELPLNSWYLDFLTKHMNIAVVSKTSKGYIKHLPLECVSSGYWNI